MPTYTIRQKIIQALYLVIATTVDPDTNAPVWNNILKENLDDISNEQLPAVGLSEGDEEVLDELYPSITKKLSVFIEFRFENKYGVDIYESFNYYLGVLQKILFTEKNLAGYSYDIQEVGNTPRIVDRNDELPGGVIMIDIYYKHINGNPFASIYGA